VDFSIDWATTRATLLKDVLSPVALVLQTAVKQIKVTHNARNLIPAYMYPSPRIINKALPKSSSAVRFQFSRPGPENREIPAHENKMELISLPNGIAGVERNVVRRKSSY
jgi:hypothetical protein